MDKKKCTLCGSTNDMSDIIWDYDQPICWKCIFQAVEDYVAKVRSKAK
jgi:hypothetical protein